MIVDLTVHGEHNVAIRRIEGLTSRFRIYDAQALMGQHSRTSYVNAAPIRTAMSDFFTHAKSLLPDVGRLLFDIEYSYYATHMFVAN